MRTRLAVFALFVSVACGCPATSPPPQDAQSLVDCLADTGGEYAPPEALSAHAELMARGTSAFAALVQNVRDPRPACRFFQEQTVERTTVGSACLDLISSQVELYSHRGKAFPNYVTAATVDEWWRRNKGKSLPELQIGAMEWAIAEIQTNESYAFLRGARVADLEKALAQLRAGEAPGAPPEGQ